MFGQIRIKNLQSNDWLGALLFWYDFSSILVHIYYTLG